MSYPSHNVLVVGAGVNGLSSAVRIQESCPGVHVTIAAEKFSPNTTSDGAGGLWDILSLGPDSDEALVLQVAKETYDYMLELSMSPLASVVRAQQCSGQKLWDTKMEEDLPWKHIIQGYRRLTQEEIDRVPGAKDGVFYTTLTIDVTTYLKWLTERFMSKGGQLVNKKIHSLEELSSDWDVVVNCVGLGSYELLQDHKMTPIRGQVFRVEAPWIKHFILYLSDESDSYVIPNSDTLVVGGVFQKDNWNTTVDEDDAKDIWDRAVKVMPNLKGAKILKSWAGLRPYRQSLRLESEVVEIGKEKRKLRMVHNYGHGGSGVTLHWGCAKRTAEMVSKALQEKESNNRGKGNGKISPSKL